MLLEKDITFISILLLAKVYEIKHISEQQIVAYYFRWHFVACYNWKLKKCIWFYLMAGFMCHWCNIVHYTFITVTFPFICGKGQFIFFLVALSEKVWCLKSQVHYPPKVKLQHWQLKLCYSGTWYN